MSASTARGKEAESSKSNPKRASARARSFFLSLNGSGPRAYSRLSATNPAATSWAKPSAGADAELRQIQCDARPNGPLHDGKRKADVNKGRVLATCNLGRVVATRKEYYEVEHEDGDHRTKVNGADEKRP